MPSLKAIRNRIASVKNTQKITKAMKLVAAARLRRAQDSIVAARPYAARMRDIMDDVTARLQLEAEDEDKSHPLLKKRAIKNVRLIIVSSDRGLAGGFNSNLFRRVERFIVDERERFPSVELTILGRKGREHFKRRRLQGVTQGLDMAAPTSEVALARARELAQKCTEDYLEGKIDAVMVAYNEFKSAITQTVKIEQLLPIDVSKKPVSVDKQQHAALIDFEYEPTKADVLTTLVPLYIEVELYRVVLESIASFFGAQMTAMDNATRNAKEMIGNLTLEFNRARQAAITKELMEIVGGAEALKG
jgi:F-type H+-transporting ATPase subunit gamma